MIIDELKSVNAGALAKHYEQLNVKSNGLKSENLKQKMNIPSKPTLVVQGDVHIKPVGPPFPKKNEELSAKLIFKAEKSDEKNHVPLTLDSEDGELKLTKKPTERIKKQSGITTQEVIETLQSMCNPEDPVKLYSNLVKIGQG